MDNIESSIKTAGLLVVKRNGIEFLLLCRVDETYEQRPVRFEQKHTSRDLCGLRRNIRAKACMVWRNIQAETSETYKQRPVRFGRNNSKGLYGLSRNNKQRPVRFERNIRARPYKTKTTNNQTNKQQQPAETYEQTCGLAETYEQRPVRFEQKHTSKGLYGLSRNIRAERRVWFEQKQTYCSPVIDGRKSSKVVGTDIQCYSQTGFIAALSLTQISILTRNIQYDGFCWAEGNYVPSISSFYQRVSRR
ncbi:hypothetical protein J6590_080974 [Homalodisca vitripennis]|nr:hypothetical protein J6590_080974 [Homalodisca vitripennis]